MANKEFFDKDKKKKSARDFRQLDELREKKVMNNNKEIMVIYPIEEKKEMNKNEKGDLQ